MRKVVLASLSILILLGACAPTPSLPAPATGLAAWPGIPSTVETTPEFIEARQGDLWVRVLSPRQGNIVQQSPVDVTGQAAPDTLININGRELLVPPDQFFRHTIALVPGRNSIEISARDAAGNQVTITLTVIYQP